MIWSKEQLDFLIKNRYQYTIDQLSFKLNHTEFSVKDKIRKLNLRNINNKWLKGELIFLYEYISSDIEKLSTFLPRHTKISILNKVKQLNGSRKNKKN